MVRSNAMLGVLLTLNAALAQSPEDLAQQTFGQVPADYLFLIDTSQSLMPQAEALRKPLADFVRHLPEQDRIGIVAVHTRPTAMVNMEVVKDSTREALATRIETMTMPSAKETDLGAGLSTAADILGRADAAQGKDRGCGRMGSGFLGTIENQGAFFYNWNTTYKLACIRIRCFFHHHLNSGFGRFGSLGGAMVVAMTVVMAVVMCHRGRRGRGGGLLNRRGPFGSCTVIMVVAMIMAMPVAMPMILFLFGRFRYGTWAGRGWGIFRRLWLLFSKNLSEDVERETNNFLDHDSSLSPLIIHSVCIYRKPTLYSGGSAQVFT
jgi:hypothetical protein